MPEAVITEFMRAHAVLFVAGWPVLAVGFACLVGWREQRRLNRQDVPTVLYASDWDFPVWEDR